MSGVGLDLLGVFAVAVGVAALIYAASHAARKAGRHVPRWVMPAAIGLAVLGFGTWREYSWATGVEAQLPARVRVIARGQSGSVFRPWTFIAPPTTRLVLLDPEAVRVAPDGTQIAPLILAERWRASLTVEQGIDCTTGRIRPPGGAWQEAPPGDAVVAVLCAGDQGAPGAGGQ